MNIAKRVILYLVLNFLVVITMSVVLSVFGIKPYLHQAGLDYVSLAVFCLIYGYAGSLISLFFSKQFAKWTYRVEVIDSTNRDPRLQELVRLVHDLSRKAGIGKMPEVGVYPSAEINAFATGCTRDSALVAVSTGLLSIMDREEIEGVLAHEISHVANGDMVTMTLLQGVVNAFSMFLARAIAWAVSRGNSSSENSGGSWLVYYLVSFVLDIVFMLLGSILIAAFSRHREFRADAGGANLAGASKMRHALEKLQSQFDRIQPVAGTASTMMITNKPRNIFERLYSSHPPLEERIKRLSEMT